MPPRGSETSKSKWQARRGFRLLGEKGAQHKSTPGWSPSTRIDNVKQLKAFPDRMARSDGPEKEPGARPSRTEAPAGGQPWMVKSTLDPGLPRLGWTTFPDDRATGTCRHEDRRHWFPWTTLLQVVARPLGREWCSSWWLPQVRSADTLPSERRVRCLDRLLCIRTTR